MSMPRKCFSTGPPKPTSFGFLSFSPDNSLYDWHPPKKTSLTFKSTPSARKYPERIHSHPYKMCFSRKLCISIHLDPLSTSNYFDLGTTFDGELCSNKMVHLHTRHHLNSTQDQFHNTPKIETTPTKQNTPCANSACCTISICFWVRIPPPPFEPHLACGSGPRLLGRGADFYLGKLDPG